MPKPKNKLQEEWHPILFPHHKHQWKKAYKRVRSKISNYKSKYDIDVEDLIKKNYNKKCVYCDEELIVTNMSLDHIVPTFRNGENNKNNIQIICNRCNRRKGVLTHIEYMDILMYLRNKSDIFKDYVLRKLAGKDWGTK